MSEETRQGFVPQLRETREVELQSVKVWFEGLPQPMAALAIPSEDGLSLNLELPHLRKNSKVFVSFNNNPGKSMTAELQEVSLDMGHVPQLLATVATKSMNDETCTDWPPQDALMAQLMEQEDEIPMVVEESIDSEDSAKTQAPESTPALPGRDSEAPEQMLLDLAESTPYSLLPPDPDAASVWALNSKDMEAGTGCCLESPQWVDPPKRHLGMWVAALLMTGLAVGSISYTQLWDRLSQKVSAALSNPCSGADITTPAKTPTAAPAEEKDKRSLETLAGLAPGALSAVDAPAPAAPSTTAPPLSSASPPAADVKPSPAEEGPRIVYTGSRPTLVIPVSGSIANAQTYVLDDPHAVVVNLPQARPKGRFEDHQLKKAGFKRLWVRKRKGGLHLRAFFTGAKPQHKLKIEEGAVRLTLML